MPANPRHSWPVRRGDLVVREVGLEQQRLPAGRPHRPVHLEQPALALLEEVLRPGQVGDLGVGHRGGQHVPLLVAQRERRADQARLVGVDDAAVRRPDLHADDRRTEHRLSYDRRTSSSGPGPAARGLPAGVDAERAAAAVRDLPRRTTRSTARAGAAVARVRRDHGDQPAAARRPRCCRSCGGCSTGSRRAQRPAGAPARARGRRLARRAAADRGDAARRRGAGAGRRVVRGRGRGRAGRAPTGRDRLAATLRRRRRAVAGRSRGLRSLLVDIYPPSLPTAGLVAALTDLAGTARTRDIDVRLDLPRGRLDRARRGRRAAGLPGRAGVPAQRRRGTRRAHVVVRWCREDRCL